jgi:sugar phosphate permease
MPPSARPATVRKIALRLLPFLFLLYIVAFLDRVNVSFAGLDMTRDLNFSDRVFGLGAGIFFIGYVVFEIPVRCWSSVGVRARCLRGSWLPGEW